MLSAVSDSSTCGLLLSLWRALSPGSCKLSSTLVFLVVQAVSLLYIFDVDLDHMLMLLLALSLGSSQLVFQVAQPLLYMYMYIFVVIVVFLALLLAGFVIWV